MQLPEDHSNQTELNVKAITAQSAENDFYPPKPDPVDLERSNKSIRFIVSGLLFAAAYYFFVSRNVQVILWLAAILFIHELGHYLAMKFFKYEDLSIFFIPMIGAVAGGSKEKISQKEKAIVLLAGPLPGIIIGVVLFFVAQNVHNDLLFRLSYAFVLLNLLNLLPIYPLDGGQLLKTLFLGSREIISSIFILGSIAVTIWFAITKEDWFLLIIPYFLIMRMLQQVELKKIRKNLDLQQVDYHKNFASLSDEEYWKIRDEIAATNTMLGRIITPGNYTVSEKENTVINYIKAILKTKPLKDLDVVGMTIFILIWIASFVIPLYYMTHIWEWL